jgi:hypothetical protein
MRRVADNSAVPPGGQWTWVHGETGHAISHPYYNELRKRVLAYLRANSFPVTGQFDEEFEANICAHATPASCVDFIPPSLLDKMTMFGRAIAKAALTWREPLVSAEVLEERRTICESCNFYGGSRSLLKVACQKCGCSGLKVLLVSQHCPLPQPKW